MEELKKAKIIRFILRIAFFLVSIVIPVSLMIVHFELTKVQTKTTTTISFYSFIVFFIIFCLIWKFKKQLMVWIESWEYSYMKYVLIGLSKVWIYGLLMFVIVMTHATILDATNAAAESFKGVVTKVYDVIEYCMIVICACECVAYLVIYPFENKYDYRVKRLLRKIERKEDYKEAVSE